MSASVFNPQLRVLLCPQCGAPVEVSPVGGASPCRFCGAQAQIAGRDESLDQVLRPQRQALPEGERLARLRQQAGKPLIPPGNILHLFDAGAIPPWRLNEAVGVWQAARTESQTTGHPDAGETVYFLAMALSSLFGEQKDVARQRAVLESSLEALRLPRHRQALRCMLARLACRSGEAEAAGQWLAPCDPASDDIEMDSPYRFARAVIATAQGDFHGVVQALGRTQTEVPLLQAVEPTCVAFRANAVERLGDVQGASALLSQYMSNRPDHTTMLEKTFEHWALFQLCAQSRGSALTVRKEQKAATASARSGGGVGAIFAFVGVTMALIGIGLLIASVVASAPAARKGKGAHLTPAATSSSAYAMPGGILLLMGVIFSGVGIPIYRSAARARRLALTGEKAQAQVLGMQPTGLAINNVPQYAITLLVQRAGGAPPYQATVKVLGTTVRPESTVPVLLDPKDPSQVILDLG